MSENSLYVFNCFIFFKESHVDSDMVYCLHGCSILVLPNINFEYNFYMNVDCDFLSRNGNNVSCLIDVCYFAVGSPKIVWT